jgi:hypothetical protein
MLFIVKHEPRNKVLINIAIICGVVGTALAGIPAIGGQGAIEVLKRRLTSIASLATNMHRSLPVNDDATIATTLRSNHDISNRLAKAQACEAKLEMLELLVTSKQIETKAGD